MVRPNKTFTYRNWAQTFSCSPELYFEPQNEKEIVAIVQRAREHRKTVKVFGAGHSPSDLPCTDGYMLNLDRMNRLLEVDETRMVVTVEGGMRLFELHPLLQKHNLALSVLGAISDQSVAGAIGTATHGSGAGFGNLSTLVLGLRLISGTGEIIDCSAMDHTDIFSAARCHIGALGIVTKVTLQCERAFRLESIQRPIPFATMLDELVSLSQTAQHTKFLWFPYNNNVAISLLNRTTKVKSEPDSTWRITQRKNRLRYEMELYVGRYMPGILPEVEKQLWKRDYAREIHRIDDSYKVFNFDCMFRQYTNEWAIPTGRASEAIKQLNQVLAKAKYPIHFPIEIRFVQHDDIWLSPCYQRDTCYIGVVMYKPFNSNVPYGEFWTDFEAVMKSMDGRPHWAKFHCMGYEDLARVYPMLPNFMEVRAQMDPDNVFMNDYLTRHLLPNNHPVLPPEHGIRFQYSNIPLKSKL
ncbi:D-arabinono-1,4-lactone oxidase [Dimargaris cristalligena]|uniref:D-arabinono-1,4-lactone oxidase n=1 Tax=Dimargaris cristalligena TaxID=215637 RepID=A0A4Q0A389_9FUNG|nr:D-arabinono-1,4-lactone oxidase [Dimargaris cristalligena]RKP39872.1 D-arabinono-1,4-lactone oxidase-domain-containing protein [Dimargaris cristalligena]|eukprot:RKP39872.1 D-arabinono-1,4-lactone oxidase-domain-containing protein [Dimargaris cristalligena]